MPRTIWFSVVAKRILETRPGLAREEDDHKTTPMHMAVHWDKIDVLRVLLEHDWSLGYVLDSKCRPILASAASRGYVGAAQELLKHCPDAPYAYEDGSEGTCLHQAVQGGHIELLEFFLGSKHLRKLVNMRDVVHETPLHDAVRKCNPQIVGALLLPDTDVTILNGSGNPATWVLPDDDAKTLNWVRLFSLDRTCFFYFFWSPLSPKEMHAYVFHGGSYIFISVYI